METETSYERLERLIGAAVRSGQFNSPSAVLKAAGLSSGYLAELRGRATNDPQANLTVPTAEKLARVLGISVAEVTGEKQVSPLIDRYPERAWAVEAARAMQLPEAAIQMVLRDDPGSDPGRWFWFRRIEAAAVLIESAPPSIRSRKRI